MSSLWTPGGEHKVPRAGTGSPPEPDPASEVSASGERDEEELAFEGEMAEAVQRLLATPAEEIVATHARGLFELARIHMSVQPPQLQQARLAIDALNCLVEGLGDRLGEGAPVLKDALGRIRLAWLELDAAARAGAWGSETPA